MSLPHIVPIGALMTMIIIYELSPQSPDRGVKNTGRGEAKRNPCKKEPPTKQSSEGTTEILSPLSGLQYAHTSFAGVSLRSTTCLCSIAPIGASICSYILCRGSATLHHLPVFLTPLSGLQFVHTSYAGVSLRCTTCLCSVAPIGACNILIHPLQGFRFAPPPACVLSPLSGLQYAHTSFAGVPLRSTTSCVLSPLSGLQYVPASYAGVPLRCTTCLCSVAPIGASICSYILCRGSASLHHLPVFCRPYRGFNMFLHPMQGFRFAAPPACVLSAPIGACNNNQN